MVDALLGDCDSRSFEVAEASVGVIADEKAKALKLRWGDGHESVFHAMWLRDNDQGPKSRHANGQRLFNLVDVPEDLTIAKYNLVARPPASPDAKRPQVENETSKQDGGKNKLVEVHFASACSQPGYSFIATYDPEFLRRHCYSSSAQRKRAPCLRNWNGNIVPRLFWDGSLDFRFHDFKKVDRTAIATDFGKYGFVMVENCGTKPGTVAELPEALFNGFARMTNYGDIFDVKVEPNPTNLAYSSAAVTPHTDNPYRDPTPTVQLLHCLRNDCPSGCGATGLVDGFRAVETLKHTHPIRYFELLSKYFVTFEYSNVHREKDRAFLRHRQPLIQIDDTGATIGIAFNNRSAAALETVPPEDMDEYYKAYRAFAKILFAPEARILVDLKPGQAMIFDNTRVLHMRESFELAGDGERWLQGCYADKDALFSELGMSPLRKMVSAEAQPQRASAEHRP